MGVDDSRDPPSGGPTGEVAHDADPQDRTNGRLEEEPATPSREAARPKPRSSRRRPEIAPELAALRPVISEGRLVNFRHVTQAWLSSHGSPDASTRKQATDLLPRLFDDFSEAHGTIRNSNFYEGIGAGIALTDIDQAAAGGHPAIYVESVSSKHRPARARELTLRALDLHNRALLYLPPRPRRILVLRLYTVLEALLAQLEGAGSAQPSEIKEGYASIEQELTKARAYYENSVQHGSQLTYFTGTLAGIAPFLAATVFMLIPKIQFLPLTNEEELLGAAALAGAAGATVSVMTRVTGGKLNLTGLEEANRWTLRLFGAIRPLIGAAFGALVFLFIFSTVLDIKVPDEPFSAKLYFLIVLGFIAGFSERFAQDTLAGAQASLGATTANTGRTGTVGSAQLP